MDLSLATTEPNPWPERRTELREREWRIYTKLITKCELAIDHLLAEPRHGISAKELTALLDLAERIGRLAAGLPKENTAQDIDGEDDRSLRLEVAAAIKKIYSQPLETLAVKMARLPQPIDIEPTNGN
jgi:hypothetical protein